MRVICVPCWSTLAGMASAFPEMPAGVGNWENSMDREEDWRCCVVCLRQVRGEVEARTGGLLHSWHETESDFKE